VEDPANPGQKLERSVTLPFFLSIGDPTATPPVVPTMLRVHLGFSAAGIDVPSRTGQTALMNVVSGSDLETARRYVARGANVNARTPGGVTPLHVARYPDFVALLIEKGADVNARTAEGETPLMRASHLQSLELLVRAGADVNAADREGRTALFAGGPEKAGFLLAHGAQVNARASDGSTPLIAAAKAKDPLTVKILLAHGADVTARTVEGETAMSIAAANGEGAIGALLREAGARR
jgi:ankyrin repeat protein